MKFEKTEVWGFEHALRGMRNPKESWSKSDSTPCCNLEGDCDDCTLDNNCPMSMYAGMYPVIIGDNDTKLAQALIAGGSEHRKFLRQIFISVDITAPLYWWKEFDQYRINITTNSTSTMHKITSKPITLDNFETDDFVYDDILLVDANDGKYPLYKGFVTNLINWLEQLRQKYLETKDKRYWKELIRWLPESWLQTRTVTMNYENVYNMIRQRGNHKLNEWSGKDMPLNENFIKWAHTLPHADKLLFVGLEPENAEV